MKLSKYSVNGILFEVPDGVTHFKFIPSGKCKVSISRDIIIFEYTKGCTAKEFCRLTSLESIYPDCVLISYLRLTKIVRKFIGLNKPNELVKLCHENLSITQLNYRIDETVVKSEYYNITILHGVDQDLSVHEYYTKLVATKLVYVNDKIDSIDQIKNAEVTDEGYHELKSDRVYLPYAKYREYRISALDYIIDFITKLSKVFEDYGFEFIEYEKLKDAQTHNIVTFKITTHSKEFLKKYNTRIPEHNIIHSGSRIILNLLTPDTDIYEDFRLRYNNLDFIQNLREFKCEDKYGSQWRYDCIWQSQLDESFAHDISSTDLNTYGYQFQFIATLEFYDVYDVWFNTINSILLNLKSKDKNGTVKESVGF